MGPYYSRDDVSVRNAKINSALKKARAKNKDTVHVLLLGPGESGKSTVFKQLKLAKGDGYPQESVEVKEIKRDLVINVVQGMNSLVAGVNNLGGNLDKQLSGAAELVAETFNLMQPQESVESDVEFVLSEDLTAALKALWNSTEVQKVFPTCRKRGQYRIPDSYPFLMQRLEEEPEWGSKEWLPKAKDWVLERVPTTGVKQQVFSEGKLQFKVIDVGGQRSERKKWLPIFEGISALLYVTSLAEYDQTLYEDQAVNRLQESIELFKGLAEGKHFRKSTFIIFFNKVDLFVEKFYNEGIPINDSGHFPDAPLRDEADPECTNAKDWFKATFEGALEPSARRKFYTHYTTALDTTKMEVIVQKCATSVVRAHLGLIGLEPNEGTL